MTYPAHLQLLPHRDTTSGQLFGGLTPQPVPPAWQACRVLLTAGANPRVTNLDGRTPADFALLAPGDRQAARAECILLLSAAADLGAPSSTARRRVIRTTGVSPSLAVRGGQAGAGGSDVAEDALVEDFRGGGGGGEGGKKAGGLLNGVLDQFEEALRRGAKCDVADYARLPLMDRGMPEATLQGLLEIKTTGVARNRDYRGYSKLRVIAYRGYSKLRTRITPRVVLCS